MAAKFKAGVLTTPGVTGNQVITGVGFQPDAIIFYTTGVQTAGGTWEADIYEAVGFAANGTADRAIANYSKDNVAASLTARRDSAGVAVSMVNNAGAVANGLVSAYGADGFTINWTVLSGDGIGAEIFYLAIGGVEASIVDWLSPTTAIDKAVTGVGFRPDLVLHLTSGQESAPTASGSHAVAALGAMDKDGGQWANGWEHLNNLNPSDTFRFQRTDRCVAASFAGTVFIGGHFASMDADGFTVTFDTAASARHVFSLCLKGLDAKVGSFNTAQLVTPTTQAVTGVGFGPSAAMFSSWSGGASTSVASQAIRSVGITDGTSHFAGGIVDQDAVTPTRSDALGYTNKSLLIPTTGPATYASGDVDSLDDDGFTIGWDAATGTAVFQMLYVAFGISDAFRGWGIPLA